MSEGADASGDVVRYRRRMIHRVYPPCTKKGSREPAEIELGSSLSKAVIPQKCTTCEHLFEWTECVRPDVCTVPAEVKARMAYKYMDWGFCGVEGDGQLTTITVELDFSTLPQELLDWLGRDIAKGVYAYAIPGKCGACSQFVCRPESHGHDPFCVRQCKIPGLGLGIGLDYSEVPMEVLYDEYRREAANQGYCDQLAPEMVKITYPSGRQHRRGAGI